MKQVQRFCVLLIILVLGIPTIAFAAGSAANSHESIVDKFLNSNSEGQEEQLENHGNETNEVNGTEHGGDNGHIENDNHGDSKGHSEGDDHAHEEADEHSHDYVEPGANIPLLTGFAAINGGFIIFGAIRKHNRRKRKSGGD